MNESKELKTLSFVKRWDHHTQSGGYDRLADYTGSGIVKTKEIPFLKASDRGFAKKLLKWAVPDSNFSNHYHVKHALAESKLRRQVKRDAVDLVHSLYAEDQLNLLLSDRNKMDAALVGTFHLPMESMFMQKLKNAGKMSRYRTLDAIITLSSITVEELKNETGNPNVLFVPHGIDTSTFDPGSRSNQVKSGMFNILTVGRHSRDWDTYLEVVSACNELPSEISFTAVVPEKISKKLRQASNIITHTSIEEKKLIELYHEADLLYMPLNYATANNSILESMACGTPVLSTNTGGIPDYVDKNSGWLVPQGGVRETVELIRTLSKAPGIIQTASVSARIKSLRFDWTEVAAQVKEVYQQAWYSWKTHREYKNEA